MKISIITSPFGLLPPHGFGAIERIWYQLSAEWIKDGNEVTFFSKKSFYDDELNYCLEPLRIVFLRGFNRTGNLFNDLILDFIYSCNAISRVKDQDVLIMNTFWSPFLFFFFNMRSKVSVYNVARFPKGQYKYLPHIDRLSCVSRSVYIELLKQCPSRQLQSKVISNPINTNIFLYKEKSKDKGIVDILYMGRIHPEKGIDILIESWKILKQKYSFVKLSLMGPYKTEEGGGGLVYVKKLNEMAFPYLIEWNEPVSDQSLIRDKLFETDIFCYPSIAENGETFGVAPLEAMATGTPTVVSSLECFMDFIENGRNALSFDHRCVEPHLDLMNKLELLICNSNLRDRIGIEGFKKSRSFSNKKIAKLYLDDFSFLLKQKYG